MNRLLAWWRSGRACRALGHVVSPVFIVTALEIHFLFPEHAQHSSPTGAPTT